MCTAYDGIVALPAWPFRVDKKRSFVVLERADSHGWDLVRCGCVLFHDVCCAVLCLSGVFSSKWMDCEEGGWVQKLTSIVCFENLCSLELY